MIVKETEYEKTSARRKRAFLVIKIAALFAASYFYYRHNALCEPIGKFWFVRKLNSVMLNALYVLFNESIKLLES